MLRFGRVFRAVIILGQVIVLYLLAVALMPGLSAKPQPIQPKRDQSDGESEDENRETCSFAVDGLAVSAWLYQPAAGEGPHPCIVMAHGLGGTKDGGLAPYAERFQEAGFAVLVFDYRHFGTSSGMPRQLLSVSKQLEDWAAAVDYARTRPEIDPDRIALWGTSFSGGHVVVTAAQDGRIACLSAQCPSMDGRANVLKLMRSAGPIDGLKAIVHGQRDLVRSWLRMSPHKIPIAGQPGTMALLTTEDAFDGYSALASETFVNEICARIVIRADKYRPLTRARQVRCPGLFQICEEDTLLDNRSTEETARNLDGQATVRRYPIGHFAIYEGVHFEHAISEQIAFFQENLS